MSKLITITDQTTLTAAREYLALKNRQIHPDGKFDSAGRWYPSDAETLPCCGGHRSPSRAYPYSYMTHCRTAEHVAHRYNVPAADVRRAARQIEQAALAAAA